MRYLYWEWLHSWERFPGLEKFPSFKNISLGLGKRFRFKKRERYMPKRGGLTLKWEKFPSLEGSSTVDNCSGKISITESCYIVRKSFPLRKKSNLGKV